MPEQCTAEKNCRHRWTFPFLNVLTYREPHPNLHRRPLPGSTKAEMVDFKDEGHCCITMVSI
jgi:hypothetical protein